MNKIYRWWKDSKWMEELSFARDRIVESYIWALGICHESKYSHGRIIMAKLAALVTVLDDTYDAYATLDELELFTNAIERFENFINFKICQHKNNLTKSCTINKSLKISIFSTIYYSSKKNHL